jgi:hypothetical protein
MNDPLFRLWLEAPTHWQIFPFLLLLLHAVLTLYHTLADTPVHEPGQDNCNVAPGCQRRTH